jgi:O-antigen/teichoic acid export membrane protein
MNSTATSNPADDEVDAQELDTAAQPSEVKENLSGKASLNAVASTLEYAARVVVGFLVKPILLSGLGDFGFGAWQILGQLIGYLAPAGGRAGHALRWSVAQQQASEDFLEKRRLIGSAFAVWLMYLPILLGLGMILVWFVPTWLRAAPDLVWPIRIAAFVLLLDMIAVNLADIPRSVLEGENLGYKRMGFSAVLVFVGGGLTWLAIYLNSGIAGVAVATLITTILTGCFFFAVVRSYVSWFGISKPTGPAIRKFFGLSGWFIAWFLVAKLMRASDVVVLGIADSVEIVSLYSVTKFVPETIVSLVAIIVFGVTPGLGGIFGKGDLERAAKVRAELIAFSWFVGTLVGLTAVLWNGSFLKLWVGSNYQTDAIVTAMIVVMMTQYVVMRTDANIIDLTLDLKQKVYIGLISTVLALISATVLVAYFHLGIMGLCAGMILGRMILSVAYPIIVGKKLNISTNEQCLAVIRPVIVSLLLVAFATWLSPQLEARSWLTLAGLVAITILVIPVPLFFAGLSKTSRVRIIERMKTVLNNLGRKLK